MRQSDAQTPAQALALFLDSLAFVTSRVDRLEIVRMFDPGLAPPESLAICPTDHMVAVRLLHFHVIPPPALGGIAMNNDLQYI